LSGASWPSRLNYHNLNQRSTGLTA